MATDSVLEFFVKRIKGKKSYMKTVGIGLGIVALIIILAVVNVYTNYSAMGLSMLVALGGIILAVFLFNRLNVEFEYSFFGGELTVDRIYNETKRSDLVEFALKSVEEFGLYTPDKANAPGSKVICTPDEEGANGIYLKVPSNMIKTGKNVTLGEGFTYIILENSERVHNAIKTSMRPSVYREGIKQF